MAYRAMGNELLEACARDDKGRSFKTVIETLSDTSLLLQVLQLAMARYECITTYPRF